MKSEKGKIEAGRLVLTAEQSPALPWFGLSSRQSRALHFLREAPSQIFHFSLFIFHFAFYPSTTEKTWA
jgi:hypothetical protein